MSGKKNTWSIWDIENWVNELCCFSAVWFLGLVHRNWELSPIVDDWEDLEDRNLVMCCEFSIHLFGMSTRINPPIFGPVYHQLSPSQHVATCPSTALGGPSGAQATPHSMQGAALLQWVFRDGHGTKYHMWRTNVDEHPSMIIYASYIDVNRRVPGFWSIATFLHVYVFCAGNMGRVQHRFFAEIDVVLVTFDMNYQLFRDVLSSTNNGWIQQAQNQGGNTATIGDSHFDTLWPLMGVGHGPRPM